MKKAKSGGDGMGQTIALTHFESKAHHMGYRDGYSKALKDLESRLSDAEEENKRLRGGFREIIEYGPNGVGEDVKEIFKIACELIKPVASIAKPITGTNY